MKVYVIIKLMLAMHTRVGLFCSDNVVFIYRHSRSLTLLFFIFTCYDKLKISTNLVNFGYLSRQNRFIILAPKLLSVKRFTATDGDYARICV